MMSLMNISLASSDRPTLLNMKVSIAWSLQMASVVQSCSMLMFSLWYSSTEKVSSAVPSCGQQYQGILWLELYVCN
jgi:hypothetical protein